MSPSEAARLAAHGRRLRAARILTVHDAAVLDTMLWRLRRPGFANFAADYGSIARLSGVCRSTAFAAVEKLQAIGLLIKTTRRVRVAWGRGRAVKASRQIANAYALPVLPTEYAGRSADRGLEIPSIPVRASNGIEAALSRLASASGLALSG